MTDADPRSPAPAESPYKSVGGVSRIANALRYSLRGLVQAVRVESAFRQQLILAAVLVPSALLLRLPAPRTCASMAHRHRAGAPP